MQHLRKAELRQPLTVEAQFKLVWIGIEYLASLRDISGKHIFEAMETGPQSMPVFSETNLSAKDKNDVISYLHEIDKNENPGGLSLGNLGPVSEGMFIWIFGMGVMVAAAVWLGAKAA